MGHGPVVSARCQSRAHRRTSFIVPKTTFGESGNSELHVHDTHTEIINLRHAINGPGPQERVQWFNFKQDLNRPIMRETTALMDDSQLYIKKCGIENDLFLADFCIDFEQI